MEQKEKSVDPIDVQIGERLRLKRTFLQLTQTQLGDKLGVSRIRIGQYESGNRSIPASHLLKLTQILKVNITFFFAHDDANSEEGIEPLLNKEAVSLIRDFQNLENPDIKKAFADIMERTAHLTQKQNA